jgi:ribosome-associated translation inhibitor RaiA
MSSPFKTRKSEMPPRGLASVRSETPYEQGLEDVSPEVKSYIYQSISEFEPFTTPETTVSVIARDPLKLISRFEADGVDFDHTKLKTMYRIAISLSEDGSKIEEEGLDEDVYVAIRIAKEKLLKALTEIQDQVISNTERKIQINTAIGGGHVH